MPASPSVGALSQLGMNSDTSSTPAAATEKYEFSGEDLSLSTALIDTAGIRGTRDHAVERVRAGLLHYGGTIHLQPNYTELAALLPRMVGAVSAQSGYGTYTVSDTVPVAFQVVIDRVAKVHTYTGCRVSQWTVKSGPGQPLGLDLGIEALTESEGNAGTFASLSINTATPFVFHDGTLTIGGTAYQMFDVSLTCNWHLDTNRFVNSQTRTDLPSTDRTVQFHCTLPYTSDTVALRTAGVAGAAVVLNFTTGGAGDGSTGVNFKMSLANVIFPPQKSPTIGGKQEIHLSLAGEARKSGSTASLICSLDSTP